MSNPQVAIIAELCQNHNGSIDTARRMADAAAGAGATHVKVQTIYAANLVFRPQFEHGLEVDGVVRAIRRPFGPEYERLKGLELRPDDVVRLVEHCRDLGVEPMTTCFARGTIDEIASQGFREIKVASYDCASYQMLRELANRFERIFVSTGATFDNEIEYAAKVLRESETAFELLHCVTIYPTPLDDLNLSRMDYLRRLASRVGFSDHTRVATDGVLASQGALALRADVIERHFTILGPGETKDGPVSVNPEQLKSIVDFAALDKQEQADRLSREAPDWRKMVGTAKRDLTPAELLNRDYYRGRFATPRKAGDHAASSMVFNWEETPV